MENDSDFGVELYIYDLSKGLANCLSAELLGKHLPGIWHSSIVVYGREYFYGSGGIESCEPGGTILGEPDKVKPLGPTEVPYSLFLEYVFSLGESTYKPTVYDLFEHNCNTFSNDIAQFLTGQSIPDEIISLPQEILNTPLGAAIKSILSAVNFRAEGSRGIGTGTLDNSTGTVSSLGRDSITPTPPTTPYTNSKESTPVAVSETAVQQNRKSTSSNQLAKRERKSKMSDNEAAEISQDADMDASPAPTSESMDKEIDDLLSKQTPRAQRTREIPPVVFHDVNVTEELASLEDNVKDVLNPEEKQCLLDIKEYLTTDCGAWALGSQHLALIGRLLGDRNLPPSVHITTLKIIQDAAYKDDWILLLHQDRQDHNIMSYLYKIENLDADEQAAIAKYMCNLCENFSSADWLMYISEWQEESRPCSNCKVTVRVAVHTVLSDKPNIQELGATLVYNLSLKEQLFDDTATEMGTAVLQALHGNLPEPVAFYCLTALLRFMAVSYNDVPALVKMLGPDLNKFHGQSERLDKLVDQINMKLTVSIAD